MDVNIEIRNKEDAEVEALVAAFRRLAWFNLHHAIINVSRRDRDGYLEYLLQVYFKEGSDPFVIGMIQRTTDAEFEFHS